MWGQITNQGIANLPFWPYLPMMYTNFGGDIQLSTIESYNSNPLFAMFNPIGAHAAGFPGIFGGFPQSPQIDNSQNEDICQRLTEPTFDGLANQKIAVTEVTLKNSITKLEAMLESSETKEEQKPVIQKAIEDLKAKQAELEELKNNKEIDSKEKFSKSIDLKSEIDKIVKDTVNKLNGEEVKKPEDETKKPEDGTKKPEDGTKKPEDGTKKPEDGTKKPGEVKRQGSNGKIDNFSSEIKKDVEAFFDATDGWFTGTDNDVMEGLIQKHTDEGTLTEFMLCWNEKASNRNKESLIEAFMSDADHSQAKKYLPLIIESLTQRAKDLGIYDEKFEEYRNAADTEVFSAGSWGALAGMDDKIICENIDAMLKLIAEKEGSKYGSKKAA